MPPASPHPIPINNTWAIHHEPTAADHEAMVELRALTAAGKGQLRGTDARIPFDGIIARTIAPEGVTFRPDTVGGVPGWWCDPTGAHPGAAILHLHGGWFNWGRAEAFRNLVGHIARNAGASAFVPDYRLAPEHPFPAALDDAEATWHGLAERGHGRVVITGDSAGGNLTLVLLARLAHDDAGRRPLGAAALSPVTDLAMTGASWTTRAAADPYFLPEQAQALIAAYLAGHDPRDPAASPLYSDLAGLPPIRIHVGDDEVLLDDSTRYVERAVSAGVDARLDIWEGMPHGFLGGIGHFDAAAKAHRALGAFLAERLATPPGR